MFIRNAILASSLIVAVLGFNSTARATSGTNPDLPRKDFSFSEELQIPVRRSPEFVPAEPRQDRLFSEPFYEGSPQPIRRYTLEPGTRGTQVTGLQQRLQVHGFDPGRADSVFGSRTEQAVRAFQQARGLEVNGIVDRGTWKLLETDPQPVATAPQPVAVAQEVLTKGTKGSLVRTLQTRLEIKGFDPGPVDGVFGSRTQAAVIAYQETKGLEVNGVVDDQTWTTLSQEWR
ncbi:putative peptidoglycan binding domain protein [Lyngbya aestuarii BL J]|uniref:Putative peptidoglycan binding domain protein n=1 Tax=Lyngbya aestuarii BL J TaxID=1348334 RepID=U7QMY4_9CYAN|nr:peptidoglycan-binding protein [Lyngbya aestuarii]ERT09248.1 putative peptidoglycan binding domain protein [Lyngbya aestuarii BL J]